MSQFQAGSAGESSRLLYEGWLETARQHRDREALRELATGRSWTFAELARAAAAAERSPTPLVHPQRHDATFVLEVLRGWRDGGVVCPLEPGQPAPTLPQPPSTCAHLKLTSATTGTARCVQMTARQLAADARNIVRSMGLRPEWPNLGVISLAHSYGFSNLVTPLLLHGIPLIIAPSPLPESLRQAARILDNLTLPGVPALWRAWHEADAIPAGTRLAISAGAPLPVALEQTVFCDRGLKIHNFYGASECGGIAYDPASHPRTEDAFAGVALHHVTLSTAADGALVVQGDNVAEGYWPDPDPALGNGRFQTPDLADLGADGVRLRGRASDLVNLAGRKVHPEAVEQCLLRHPAVRDCLAFGIEAADRERGEELVMVVVSHPPQPARILRGYLLDQLPAWQVPRHWWEVSTIGVNQRGKVSRAEWRQRFRQRGPSASSA
jgi:long-chain acyl-CoA synthetase